MGVVILDRPLSRFVAMRGVAMPSYGKEYQMKVERGTRLDAAEAALGAHGEIRGMRLGRSAAGIMGESRKKDSRAVAFTRVTSHSHAGHRRDTLQHGSLPT